MAVQITSHLMDHGGVPRSIVIGTAGHIDHGKTAVVRALTGVDTDRLPDEKRRGITIDLGFASLDAESIDKSPLRVSFIDVPGHALFVRNMLAGTGGIDAVMLVISAEEGVKPQTEEHLAICTLLGIERGLTVITKTDTVSDVRLNEIRQAVEHFLGNTPLAASLSPIIPVSAKTGAGIEQLRHELIALASRIPSKDTDMLPRLPLDRAFVMKGFGAVVTGTLIAGTVKADQLLSVEPEGRTARVRGIQVHGHVQQSVSASTRVAFNMAGIQVSELKRGDTLVEPSTIVAVDTIDAELSILGRTAPLKHNSHVHFHAFASDCMAAVSLYEYHPIEAETRRLARLRLSNPIVLLPGDRFVIRNGSPLTTIGGGRVLDVHPIPRLKKTACREWLQQVQNASADEQIVLRIARRAAAGISLKALSVETGKKNEALCERLKSLIQHSKLVLLPNNLLLTHDAFEACLSLLVTQLEAYVKETPAGGSKRAELRNLSRLEPEVFDSALEQLVKQRKLRIHNDLVVLVNGANHELDPDRAQLSTVSAAFEAAGLAPPSPEELARRMKIEPTEMHRLITQLLREKTLVRLGSDTLCMHHSAVAQLKKSIETQRGRTIDVAYFKTLTGVSRKYAIPLLEYLDRERITRKLADYRIVL
ncbi:selenocysteine-specific translation elongation factor [Alloacidobacterium sp.]|uniref:selenocysteine-specific translation elongation factor n=1 Tax=Alloacidobacterium sp. TaxID=2951999 RepID=UPI002D232DB6|nr:selenocysteine-specific translation elongation factor [Alloacidobacterium sp.]HYK37863.1 selenocysteine-specific translation elongation factor [Alloacidobacterium sp.]